MLSQACVVVFAALLAALDIGAYWFASWFVQVRLIYWQLGILLMVSIYSGSVLAWICLYRIWRLIANIKRGEVFVPANVAHMRAISWCCVWAAAICLASAAYYLPFGSSGELAEKIGITPANLSILKTGKAKAIRFSTLMALCHELDCQPGDILEFKE